MAKSAESVESEALSLSREDRTRLVTHLLESIDERPGSSPRKVEQEWLKEANRRYRAYLHGEEQAIPAEEVFSNLRADDR